MALFSYNLVVKIDVGDRNEKEQGTHCNRKKSMFVVCFVAESSAQEFDSQNGIGTFAIFLSSMGTAPICRRKSYQQGLEMVVEGAIYVYNIHKKKIASTGCWLHLGGRYI